MNNTTSLATEAIENESVATFFGDQLISDTEAVAELAAWLDANQDKWTLEDEEFTYNGPEVIEVEGLEECMCSPSGECYPHLVQDDNRAMAIFI